jgi:hypothetical protein
VWFARERKKRVLCAVMRVDLNPVRAAMCETLIDSDSLPWISGLGAGIVENGHLTAVQGRKFTTPCRISLPKGPFKQCLSRNSSKERFQIQGALGEGCTSLLFETVVEECLVYPVGIDVESQYGVVLVCDGRGQDSKLNTVDSENWSSNNRH